MRRGALIAAAALLLAGCGGGDTPRSTRTTTSTAPPARTTTPQAAPQRLALGISEANPNLIDPGTVPAPFARWRDRLVALEPTSVRVFYDWAQDDGDLARAHDGCLRDLRPCAPYAGLRAQLRAIAAQQRRHPGRFEVSLAIYGVPERFARPAGGCERDTAAPRSRPITAAGLAAYQDLLRRILALARGEGAPVTAVAPWNEPNHPTFISPQRATCDAGAPSRAPVVYARLARAAREVIRAQPAPQPALVLGELAGYDTPTAQRTPIGEFVAGLPDDLACAASAWSVHDYARTTGRPARAVEALEDALAKRSCTADKPIRVTETGAVNRPTRGGGAVQGCRRLAALLARWDADPRVEAVYQYSFREDPSFPVGLVDATLAHEMPSYDLWRAWAQATSDGSPPSAASCD